MRVLKIEAAYGLPQVINIEDTLEELQKQVGGYIEMIRPFNNDIVIICNEDGKRLQLPLTRAIIRNNRAVDALVGNLIICAARPGSEELDSLTDAEIKKYVPILSSFSIICDTEV
jgi:hypothetical protein